MTTSANYQTLIQIRDAGLEHDVRPLYGSELPYHNFDHALDTLEAGGKIIERCRQEAIVLDPRVVYFALLFHDAGYHEDHRELGFDSKESYSAHLAVTELGKRSVSREILDQVDKAIMSTHHDGSFVTAEQRAVRAADLSGLAAPYRVFLVNTLNLKREYELLHETTQSWDEWRHQAAATIERYLSQDIPLTSYFLNKDGNSAFCDAVRKNLQQLLEEPDPEAP